MFDLIRKIWQTGTVTKQNLFDQAPDRFRGKPVFVPSERQAVPCESCKSCITACPANAIDWLSADEGGGKLVLSYASCIFCGICAEVCDPQLIRITNDYRLASKDKQELIATLSVGMQPKNGIQ